jgi:hypothetical protein
MSNRNFVNKIPDHARNPEDEKLHDANMHAGKELGLYYDYALQNFGGSVKKLSEEAASQLKALSAKGVPLREGNRIITGLLDLKKFGLSQEMIDERKEEFGLEKVILQKEQELTEAKAKLKQCQRMEDARLHAQKELGIYFQDAVDAKGSSALVVKEARTQLDQLEANGTPTRQNNLIVVGLLNLEQLGLTPEAAAKRTETLLLLNGDKLPEGTLNTSGAPQSEVGGGNGNGVRLSGTVNYSPGREFAA